LYSLFWAIFAGISCPEGMAQNVTSSGTSFAVAFLQNASPDFSQPDSRLSVSITTVRATRVELFNHDRSYATVHNIAARSTVEITVPPNLFYIPMPQTSGRTGLFIEANDTIQVLALNYQPNSADAAMVLPIQALGNQYDALTYGENSDLTLESEFLVMAIADNTRLRLTIQTAGERPREVLLTLNRGECAIYRNASDLVGSQIALEDLNGCQTFAVFVGNRCASVGDCFYCNHLYEQMPPVRTYGKQYYAMPLRMQAQYIIRILGEPGTRVNLDGVILTIGPNRVLDTTAIDPMFISAQSPIIVGQYSTGSQCQIDKKGDPSFSYLPALDQSPINSTAVVAQNLPSIDSTFANVVIRTADVSSFLLNGVSVANQFKTGSNGYSYAQLTLTVPTNQLSSPQGFYYQVYGFGMNDGFAYSGRSTFEPLAIKPSVEWRSPCDRPQQVQFSGLAGSEWVFGDGQRGTGTRVTHQYQRPGEYWVKVKASTNNACPDSLSFRLNINFPLRIRSITSTATNTPRQANGRIAIQALQGRPPLRYSIDNGANYQPNHRFVNVATGRYVVRVQDSNGCQRSANVHIE
jgi:hypothetical protein